MANADAPFGARPVRHMNGSPYNGATMRCFVPASDGTALFIGDAVKSAGSADADGVPTAIRAAAGNTILGIVVSFEADSDNLSLKHREASTARYVNVCTSPDVIFEIQEDADGGALAATEIGNNADVIYTVSGSTTSGRSGMELDSSDASTSTAQLRILRLVPRADNEIGANGVYEVLINEHEYKTTTGT
jgi:hypothetical protein